MMKSFSTMMKVKSESNLLRLEVKTCLKYFGICGGIFHIRMAATSESASKHLP